MSSTTRTWGAPSGLNVSILFGVGSSGTAFDGFELVVERLGIDAEGLCGPSPMALVRVENRHDVLVLGFRQRQPPENATRAGAPELEEQIPGVDGLGLAEDRCSLNDHAQFADVTRPGVARENLDTTGTEAFGATRELLEKVRGEQGDVSCTIPQRRQSEGDAVEAVIEVLAVLSALHGG